MGNRSMLAALSGVAVTLAAAGTAHAQSGLWDYTPVDRADYVVSEPYGGNVFFRTPDGRHCAIYWNNGPTGCDAVPIDAPEWADQLRVGTLEAAHFVDSERPTFTHPEAKVLPEGHRVTSGNATCGVGYQGTVTCEVGEHGFTLAATYSVLY
ncbi:hypothetical protein [Nocardia neocaledoniensis]|uniref:hypothetical protein n=1 Tax=Nocardia neocaledoniensis TaxID=236511 RepID=UPI002456BADD|nr:hypothetical protein [Nocardia neocaledoniensis]